MNCILRSVRIIDPNSAHNGKVRDILIENGSIKSIKAKINDKSGHQEIESKGALVSPGWFDMCANFCDPGEEHREDLPHGLKAAAAGGFTGVLLMPDTHPSVSSKSEVEYIRIKGSNNLVDVEVSGSLTERMQGKQISEYGDMKDAGALGFTDYKKDISNPEVLIRALEYAKNFDSIVLSFPFDSKISPGGMINEGEASVMLGLKGIPHISEVSRLKRDLDLMEYSGGRMHVHLVSTKESVELIKNAKKKGLPVTCGVAAHQLSFTDSDLSEFDTRLKVLPPFRSEKDRKAIIKALKDGVIDVVCSDHSPVDIDHKKIEFEYAEFGISGIETAFSSINTSTGDSLEDKRLIELLSINPRRILGIEIPSVSEGSKANLTVFNRDQINDFDTSNMKSKSQNNPFKPNELKGKVVAVINNNKLSRF